MKTLEKDIDRLIQSPQFKNALVEIRREFHKYPELSDQEYQTMERICSHLEKWGISYEKGVASTDVVATIFGSQTGKTVGMRADMDALPIAETNDLTYKSQNPGVMHACGHDAHVAILLGVAKVMKGMENELNGNVKFFFQPAEETTGGARRMIENGCLENPHVDYVLGLHVEPKYATGRVGIRYGKMYASSDMLKLEIKGKSSHGAHPDKGVDAIIVASTILNTLQTLTSRNISPVNSIAFTFGTIHGGSVGNQIADHVELEGILRTLDPETRDFAKKRVRDICRQVASSMGAEAILTIRESYSPLINDDHVVDVVLRNTQDMVGKENIIIEDTPDLGAEDFSYFAEERKSCYFHLGCSHPNSNSFVDLHNPGFDIDEDCLALGVKLQVGNILSLLK